MRRVDHRVRARVLAGLLVGLAGMMMAPGSTAARPQVLDLPVSFQVKNTDTSRVRCASDGAAYTERGHLTGPRLALKGPAARGHRLPLRSRHGRVEPALYSRADWLGRHGFATRHRKTS